MPTFTSKPGYWERIKLEAANQNGALLTVRKAYIPINGEWVEVYRNGSGTEADPYLIWNAEDLKAIRYEPEAHYALALDITFESREISSMGWTPIPVFSGELDGRGHRIKIQTYGYQTYNVVPTDEGYAAGFIGVNEGTVKNLSMGFEYRFQIASGVEQTDFYLGGIAAYNKGTIEQCYVDLGDSSRGYGKATFGGIAGKNCAGGVIRNCISKMVSNLNGNGSGGMLAGENNGTILTSYVDAHSLGLTGTCGYTDFNHLVLRNSGTLNHCIRLYVAYDALSESWLENYNGNKQVTRGNYKNAAKYYPDFDFTNVWRMTDYGPSLRYTA